MYRDGAHTTAVLPLLPLYMPEDVLLLFRYIPLSKTDTQKKLEQNFTISAEKIEKQIAKYY